MDNKIQKKDFITAENPNDNHQSASGIQNLDEDDDDKGNMLGQFDNSDIDFGDKDDDEEEKEEDKMFGMGKNGELWLRSSEIYNIVKQRQLAEQQASDYLFNLKQWE